MKDKYPVRMTLESVEIVNKRLSDQDDEIKRLRALLGEAAWYVDHYGDSRKDRSFYRRFYAASRGEPEPGDEDDEVGD